MLMPQNLFTGIKATYYDSGSPEMWDLAVLGATAEFLTRLAQAVERWSSGSDRSVCVSA